MDDAEDDNYEEGCVSDSDNPLRPNQQQWMDESLNLGVLSEDEAPMNGNKLLTT